VLNLDVHVVSRGVRLSRFTEITYIL